MAAFALLKQEDEDKLHASRLLSVEEKPFRRITKRLLSSTSPFQVFSASRLLTPPAAEDNVRPSETDEASQDAEHQQSREKHLAQLAKFRTDVLLDFAAFDASIARLQFLRAANAKERARYTAEKDRVLHTAEEVRENTAQLRVQLDEAQRTLAVRKTYDELAEKIVKDERLKPRAEQSVAIEKLRVEIEDLEREGRELDASWVERREAWRRVVEEGARVRRVVRGEPEPSAEDDHDKAGSAVGDRDRDVDRDDGMLDITQNRSGATTPLPPAEDAQTPEPSDDVASGQETPVPESVMTEADAATNDSQVFAATGAVVGPGRSKLNIVETAEASEDHMDTT